MKGEDIDQPPQQRPQNDVMTKIAVNALPEGRRGLRIEPRMPQSRSVKAGRQRTFQPRLTTEILDSTLPDNELQKRSKALFFTSTWKRIRNKDFRGLIVFLTIISIIIYLAIKGILDALAGVFGNGT
jgi:hypothetical protein